MGSHLPFCALCAIISAGLLCSVESKDIGMSGQGKRFIPDQLSQRKILQYYRDPAETPNGGFQPAGREPQDPPRERAADVSDSCSHLDAFPQDIWTDSPSLERFGGGQDQDDGSIDIYELRFRLPTDHVSPEGKLELSTQFKTLVDSVMKVECVPNDRGVSVGLQLKLAARESAAKISRGVDKGSLLVPFLPKSTERRYDTLTLAFDVGASDHKGECLSFQLFLRIETLETVLDEFRCPAQLPSSSLPSSTFRVDAAGPELHVAHDNLMITPPDMVQFSRGPSFAYPMRLTVEHGEVAVEAVAGFDWVLSDLHLVLSDQDDQIVARSNRSSALDVDGPFETSTRLHRTLRPGAYTLYIFDAMIMHVRDTAERGTEAQAGVCLGFSFQLDAAPAGKAPGQPRITLLAVDPGVALHLQPSKPLTLTLRFSKALGRLQGETAVAGAEGVRGQVECGRYSEQGQMVGEVTGKGVLCEDAAFLFPEDAAAEDADAERQMQSDVRPRRFRVMAGGAEVEVTFGVEKLRAGRVYLLHLEDGFFKGADGRVANVRQHVGVHEYALAEACSCGSRGRCVAGACVCDAPYTGDACAICAQGYHLSESGTVAECVRDKVKSETKAGMTCDRYSCNGHGSCVPVTGSEIDCLCDIGYETGSGKFCAVCAAGYSGYPNCRPETEEEVREEEGCRLPLLPVTLDQEGLLGSEGKLHLQGDYFLDTELDSHVIPFTVRTPSLVRVEVDVGRHTGHVAIAAALEKRRFGGGGTASETVDRSKPRWIRVDSGGGKGSIAVEVEGSHGPAKREGQSGVYRLVLAYEVLGGLDLSGEGACTSVSLEMAVTPVGQVRELAKAVQARCPNPPETALPLPDHIMVPPTGWSIGGCHFLSPSAGAHEGGREMVRGTALQYTTLEVPAVAGKMARLRAELGFRFEVSHWRLMLERDPESGEAPACQLAAKTAEGHAGKETSKAEAEAQAAHGQREPVRPPPPIEDQNRAGERDRDEGSGPYGAADPGKHADDQVPEGEGKYLPQSDPGAPYAHVYGKEGRPLPPPTPHMPSPYGHIYADSPPQPDAPEVARPYYSDDSRPRGPYADPVPPRKEYRDATVVPGIHVERDEQDAVDKADPEVDEDKDQGFDLQDVIQKALQELSQDAQHNNADGDNWQRFPDNDDDEPDAQEPPRGVHWPGSNPSADPYGGRGGGRDPYGGAGRGPYGGGGRGRDPYGGAGRGDPYGGARGGGGPDFGAEEHWQGGRRLLQEGPFRRGAAHGGGLGKSEGLRCLTGRDQWNRNLIDEPLAPGRYVLWVARDPGVEGTVARDHAGLSCLPLDMSVEVSYEAAPASPATCPGRTLPTDLQEAGYLHAERDEMHVQGEYNMRDARVKGRHVTSVRVRQSSSLFRAHVQSLHAVDIRLDLYRRNSDVWDIVRAERPHMEGGLRGDSVLAVLEPGEYRLQIAFLNPGGGPGMPEWDDGTGTGRERECEVMEVEMALGSVESLAGEGRACPDNTELLPDPQLVGVLREESSFDVAPRYDSVAAALFSGMEGTPYSGALGSKRYFAQASDRPKGFMIGRYRLEPRSPVLVRAGLSSDFLHDDLILQVFDKNNRLVLSGQHRRSYSHIHAVLAAGSYTLVIRQPMSAYGLLGGGGGGEDWEARADEKQQRYWYNSKTQTTQWERPPAKSGSRCSRFSFWVAVDAMSTGEQACRLQRGLVQSLPPTLDVPGMLGLHRSAYLQGTFPVAVKRGGGALLDTVKFTVKEKSLLRAVVASNADDQGVMSQLKLYSSDGSAELKEVLVDVGTPLGPEFTDQQWGRTDYGNRLVMTTLVGDDLERGASKQYVLAVHHFVSDATEATDRCSACMLQLSIEPVAMMTAGEVARKGECGGSEVWPALSSDLTAGMYSCDNGDANFRCINELRSSHFLQEKQPRQKQYAVRLNELSNLRLELGFRLAGPSMVAVIEHRPCPQGGTQGPCEDSGSDGRGPWGGRPMVSEDLGGGAVLNVHWVPAGRYLITIAEQARGLISAEGVQCVPFSFRAMVERAEVHRETDAKGSPAHTLPADLHGTPYLAFLNQMHLFGRFAFPRAGPQSHTVAFHISHPHTLLRLEAQALVGELKVTLDKTEYASGSRMSSPERVRTLGPGGGSRDPRLRGSSAEVLADLDEGGYQISFRYHPSDWSLRPPTRGRQRANFRLQLAIAPNVETEARQECDSTDQPALSHVVGGAAWHKHWKHLAFGRESSTLLTTRRLLHTIPLTAQQPARLRVQIRSRFLSSALSVALLLPAPSDSDSSSSSWPAASTSLPALPAAAATAPPPPACSAGYNSCELDVILPNGPVQIAIFQPLPLPDALSHCLRYSLLVTMHPTSLDYGTGCMDQPQLPTAMAQLVGGAGRAEGGGHGAGVLYWDWRELTVPSAEEDTVQEAELAWVEGESVLHVVWEEHVPGLSLDIALASGKPVQETWQEVVSYWNTLHEGTFGMRALQAPGMAVLRVHSHIRGQRHPCPLWGTQIFLRPLQAVKKAGACPPGAGETVPPSVLALNGNGFGVLEVTVAMPADTWPPLDDERCVSSLCDRSHDISFSPASTSHLQVSLEFDPLVVSYSVLLIQVLAQSSSVAATAVPAWPPPSSPPRTLKRVSLSHQLPAGSFLLRITRGPALGGGRGEGGARGLCSPFRLHAAVTPLPDQDTDQPLVLEMWPAGGRGLEKGRELVVRMLLSEGVDLAAVPDSSFQLRPLPAVDGDRDWSLPTAHPQRGDRTEATYLQSSGNEVRAEEVTAVVGGGAVLELRFTREETARATVGVDYVLWFKDAHYEVQDGDKTRAIGTPGAVLGVRTQEAFVQPPPWTFTFRTSVCSGRGKQGAYGLCECERGRAGWECEACDPHYTGGCDAAKQEGETGAAGEAVLEGGATVTETELQELAKADAEKVKAKEEEEEAKKVSSGVAEEDREREGGGVGPHVGDAEGERKADTAGSEHGWDGDFHYKKEPGGGGGNPPPGGDGLPGHVGSDPVEDGPYAPAPAPTRPKERHEPVRNEGPYGPPRGEGEDGPYGAGPPSVDAGGSVEKSGASSQDLEGGGGSGVVDGPVVNADGSVDAESMAAWERAQRQKRKEAAERQAALQDKKEAALLSDVKAGGSPDVTGILCSFLTCHDDAGWSAGWLVGGLGLVGVGVAGSFCFLRRRLSRQHDSYRMLRIEDDL